MSDSMRDALTLNGILIAIVLFTQVGRHKFGFIKLTLPISLVAVVGYFMLKDMEFSTPNMTVAGVGVAIGAVVGAVLLLTMRVERDGATGKTYTRAGIVYFAIWLAILVARLVFIWSLENVDSFARDFGTWVYENKIDAEGVAAFFVLMAMAMVLIRTIGVTIQWLRGPRHTGEGRRVRQAAAAGS
ncbi:hypothetical protein ACWGI8_35850 [Streptomyces sp. NPDC054841]